MLDRVLARHDRAPSPGRLPDLRRRSPGRSRRAARATGLLGHIASRPHEPDQGHDQHHDSAANARRLAICWRVGRRGPAARMRGPDGCCTMQESSVRPRPQRGSFHQFHEREGEFPADGRVGRIVGSVPKLRRIRRAEAPREVVELHRAVRMLHVAERLRAHTTPCGHLAVAHPLDQHRVRDTAAPVRSSRHRSHAAPVDPGRHAETGQIEDRRREIHIRHGGGHRAASVQGDRTRTGCAHTRRRGNACPPSGALRRRARCRRGISTIVWSSSPWPAPGRRANGSPGRPLRASPACSDGRRQGRRRGCLDRRKRSDPVRLASHVVQSPEARRVHVAPANDPASCGAGIQGSCGAVGA